MTTAEEAHLSEAQRAEIALLVTQELNEDALFEALGRTLGAPATGEEPAERGREAFRRRRRELRERLCGHPAVSCYLTDPNISDMTALVATVAGVLVASNFGGLNVVLVAALVARLGLRSLCQTST